MCQVLTLKLTLFHWAYNLPAVSLAITKHAVDTIEEEAGAATFSCDASGEPTPEFYWTHNSEDISDGGRYSLTNNNKSVSMSSLVYNDRGVYTCFAFNVVNEVNTSATLTVNGELGQSIQIHFCINAFNVYRGSHHIQIKSMLTSSAVDCIVHIDCKKGHQ